MTKLHKTQSAAMAQTLVKRAQERGAVLDVNDVQKTLETQGVKSIDSILQGVGFSPVDAEATAAFMTAQSAKPSGAKKSARDAAMNIEQRRGLDAFDTLWNQSAFEALVPVAKSSVEKMQDTDFASMDLDTLSDALADLHLLQHRLIGLSNKLSMVSQPEAKLATLKMLQELGPVQADAFEVTVDKTNQIDSAPVTAWVVHKNTRKKPGASTYTQRMEYFAKKSREFIAMGGSLSDIKPVAAESLAGFESGKLLEFVVDETDTARMASADKDPTPGHTLLAMGRDALTAGSLRLYKNDAGEIEQAVVGTFSGHFRADATTLGHMVRHLVLAGVDPAKISVQGGEAGSARALEIIHRTLGRDGAMIQAEQSELDGRASRYNPYALQVAEPGAEKVKVKIEHAKVQDALLHMRQKSAAALADGALLDADRGEVSSLAAAIDTTMNEASKAGNPVAFEQAKTLLAFLVQTPAKDDAASKVLKNLQSKWQDHKLGAGLADPADVISRRPADGRRARIVATINPEATKVQLAEMIKAGLDVARFNPAHASIPELKSCMERVRETAASLGTTVNIQLDLAGPKIRLGKFENPNNLEFNDIFMSKGDVVTLTNKPGLGTTTVLPMDLESLGDDVKVGDRLFMNDGLVEMVAKEVTVDDKGHASVKAEVVLGGKVWDRKGVNMPDSKLSLPTITDDDLLVLDGLADQIDLLALSFVREPEDIIHGREELKKRGVDVPIIAKIERPEAVENLVAIAHLSDGMMVARGDLGVEIGRQHVPRVERRIHKLGNQLGKPTMTATEVLMSMAKGSARATRGDIEALYAAVYDHGADSIMLGKETSFPDEPGRVVREAALTIGEAESELAVEKYAPSEFGE